MTQFKAIEKEDGETFVINRDYVVTFEPKYGDPKTSGYLTLQKGAHRCNGFHVSKRSGEEVHQWLLND